jgi:pilus assembly protein Flp/PilA
MYTRLHLAIVCVNGRIQFDFVFHPVNSIKPLILLSDQNFARIGTPLALRRVPRLRLGIRRMENFRMNNLLLKLYVKFQDLKDREEGQDLVEYALVVALIAFGATAGMGALAGGINRAFNTISQTLGTSI